MKEKLTYESPATIVVEMELEKGVLIGSGNAQLDVVYGEEDF